MGPPDAHVSPNRPQLLPGQPPNHMYASEGGRSLRRVQRQVIGTTPGTACSIFDLDDSHWRYPKTKTAANHPAVFFGIRSLDQSASRRYPVSCISNANSFIATVTDEKQTRRPTLDPKPPTLDQEMTSDPEPLPLGQEPTPSNSSHANEDLTRKREEGSR